MKVLIFCALTYLASSQPTSVAQKPRGRLVQDLNIIYVEWHPSQLLHGTMFTVRHRSSETLPWRYIKTAETNVRIPITYYKNSDTVTIQIKSDRDGQVLEDWTTEIRVDVIGKKASSEQHNSISLVAPKASDPVPTQPKTEVKGSQIQPPVTFTANILNPTTVQLKWLPVENEGQDVYYLVNIKQLTTATGSTLQNQQIKTAATSFTMGKMIAGEKYEMTIRSVTGQNVMSPTAAIVEISMPKESDFFEIGNLIISSHFRSQSTGIVNLTWEVPPTMQNKIMSYNVEYSEMGSGYWQKIQFHGASSSAALHHLKSNTEYLLRIKTVLRNNIVTESGQFRFRTPKVETNPIHKVDVIYSHDTNFVKLQWILEPHVQIDKVGGYDVYLSQNKDLPDSQWKLIRLNSKESSLSLDDLKSSTVYFVRVNVRNLDGSVISAPAVYRFKTIDANDEEEVEGNSLSFRNVAPGQVEIRWSFPKHVLDSVIGATILYTDRKDLTPDQWDKIEITESSNTSVTLKNLKEGARYSVQIIPRLYTGDYDFESRELFEVKTDRLSYVPPTMPESVKTLSHLSNPLGGPRFQQMEQSETEFMRIVSCNPDAIKTPCAWDEICINRVEDGKKGWCISNTLRDSILNS